MRKSKEKKNWLYRRYLAENEEAQEIEKISDRIGEEKEKIVIKKVSTPAKILEIFMDVIFALLKTVFFLFVMFLSSIGLTVLLNEQLRNIVFSALFTDTILKFLL